MRIAQSIAQVRQLVREARSAGKSIGLVPTMGYLHDGHLALLKAAKTGTDFVVVSIFVNPTQFGPNEDFENYPRDVARDETLLQDGGCDVLFLPSVEEMYPKPLATTVELAGLGQTLCGASRPTHFRGVTTVVSKLLHITMPDKAYFGQKDGQQALLIQRMVFDLNIPSEIVTVPTVREADGLAKSSRNVYLTDEERPHATVLYKALQEAKQTLMEGVRSGTSIAEEMRQRIANEPMIVLDYAEVVSRDTLEPLEKLEGPIMLAVAAFVGKARLIDNVQLTLVGDDVIEG